LAIIAGQRHSVAQESGLLRSAEEETEDEGEFEFDHDFGTIGLLISNIAFLRLKR
jgi:hypothetical protein